ncbi:MAG: outer membrane lipoprotein-sorting protein [Gammaproteobacteria bacterium]|nr:outer membrane lipoprotein-sorting protein [Gammaproteobacteria bacterium]
MATLSPSRILCALGLALLVPLSFSAEHAAPAQVSAAQIVEKNIAARGGLSAWHGLQTLSMSGKMDAGKGDSTARSLNFARGDMPGLRKKPNTPPPAEAAQQVQVPFTLEVKRPRMSRLEIVFAGKTAIQVYDGTNGWKIRPFLNRNDVEPFSAEELKSESQWPGIDGPLVDYASKGIKVELAGTEAVEGHDAYKLRLTHKDGTVQHIWIDAQSFLDVKVEGTPRRMDGKMRSVWIYQRDFRPVQGLMLPFVLETAVDGYHDTHKMAIEKATVNPNLAAVRFAKPGGA